MENERKERRMEKSRNKAQKVQVVDMQSAKEQETVKKTNTEKLQGL